MRHSEYKYWEYEHPVKFASDNLFTEFLGFTMRRNHRFFKTFRDILQKLFEAGIVQYIDGMNVNKKGGPNSIYRYTFSLYERMPLETALSWNYLYAGITIWMGFVVPSFAGFTGELWYEHIVKKEV